MWTEMSYTSRQATQSPPLKALKGPEEQKLLESAGAKLGAYPKDPTMDLKVSLKTWDGREPPRNSPPKKPLP